MKTKELQKTAGMKLAVLSFVMLMLLAGSISAQHHQGPPPPPGPNIDSIILSQIHERDSIFRQHGGDTILAGHHNQDSIALPPNWNDSISVGGNHGHGILPGPPPSVRDSTWTGGIHDSIPGPPPPPNRGDSISTGGNHGHDSIPAPPPPPPSWRDSSNAGGPPHDSIPCPSPPPPPNWGDSTGTGGNDSTGIPPHRDLLVTSESNASATLLVFPNPVFETATIRIQNASSTVTFRMYESTGRLVTVMTNLSNGDFQLNKGNMTAGIYFYEMLDGNTIASKGSLIIQ